MGLKKDIGFKGYEDQLNQSNKSELNESNNKKSKIIIASILGVVAIIVIIIIVLMIIPMVSDSTSDSFDNATQATSNSESYDFDYLFGTSDDDEETTSNDENSDSESSQVPRMTIVPNSHSSSSSIPESNNNDQNSKSDSGSNSNSSGSDSNNNQNHSVTNNSNNNKSDNNSGNNNYHYNNNNNNHSSSSSYHKPESSKKEENSRNTDIPVNNVFLNYTSTTLYEGESINLVASVSPSNATNKTVYWSSSNSDVASVDGGYVTAHSSGTTYITARAGNYYVNCMVTVKERDNIKLSPDRKTISKNQVITIKVVGSNQKASWKISNPSIVQICGGSETSLMIKGKNTGTTYIEATVNGKTYKAEITVN